ncbi:MAG: DMT family transporter [Pseudomonadota bacterium]|jgi:O-acetylserine/cysteine efflux transporter
MSAPHLALILFITLVWGFNYIAGKAGVTEFPPFLFTGLRFFLLSILLLPFLKWHKGQMRSIAIISLTMGGVHFAIFYMGLAAADDVSTIAIAGQLGVPFATIMSIVFLGEQVHWRRWAGIALSFAGVMIIGFDPVVLQYLDGLILVILAALIGSTAMIFMRRLQNVGVFELQAWIALLSWPVLAPLSLLLERGQIPAIGNASWAAWGGVLYTVVGTSLIGHAGMYYLLQRYEVTQTAPLTLLSPVWGVFFGVTLLGDNLSPSILFGGLITLLGVGIVTVRQKALVDTGG